MGSTERYHPRYDRLKRRGANEAMKSAMRIFFEATGMSQSQLAEILGVTKSVVSEAKRGVRADGKSRALLFLATKDTAFAPVIDSQKQSLEFVNANMPPLLKEFLEKGSVPERTLLQQRLSAIKTGIEKPRKETRKRIEKTLESPKAQTGDDPDESQGPHESRDHINPAYATALKKFLDANESMPYIDLARIIACDRSVLSRLSKGVYPHSRVLARLYIVTKDEAFAPNTVREREQLQYEQAHMLKSMRTFLSARAPVQEPHVPDADFEELLALMRKFETLTDNILSSKQDMPEGVIDGEWYNKVLAGTAQLEGQVLDGIRFVVTTDRFRPLQGDVTDGEIQETVILFEELRRRLLFFSRIHDPEVQAKVMSELTREIRETFLAMELASHVTPGAGVAEEIQAKRKRMKMVLGDEPKSVGKR